MPTASYPVSPRWLLPSAGLLLALGLPAAGLIESRLQATLFAAEAAAAVLAATPWLVLAWVRLVERRPLASIGFRRPAWSALGYAGSAVIVNVAINAGIGTLNARSGLPETESALMTYLRQGAGWLLVLLATNGACLTEIAFRGYALERLLELTHGRVVWAAGIQIVLTMWLFVVSRGLGHGVVWLLDDVVFSAFYLWRRDLWVCLLAHALPNFIASTLVAIGAAT